MSKSQSWHVVPQGRDWIVRREGMAESPFVYKTKHEAIDAARRMFERKGACVIIHGRQGQALLRSPLPSSLDGGLLRKVTRELAVGKTPSSGKARANRNGKTDAHGE